MAGRINAPIFITASQADRPWAEHLVRQLQAYADARVELWDDTRLGGDGEWYDELKKAIDGAWGVLCVLSPAYLASAFVAQDEFQFWADRARRDGIPLIPVLLHACEWQELAWLREAELLPLNRRPLEQRSTDKDELKRTVLEPLLRVLDGQSLLREELLHHPGSDRAGKVDVDRLPMTRVELLGRQRELRELDRALHMRRRRIVSLVAEGGLGKTALVNKWLQQLESEGWPGAQRVLAWAFQDETSADLFVAWALGWFGTTEPIPGSAWGKGELLARVVGEAPTLLVLDGLEALQSTTDGRLLDPALLALLLGLTRQSSGLSLLTTRQPVADLEQLATGAFARLDVQPLAPEAGRALLRIGGLRGTNAELDAVAASTNHHPLALSLLVGYANDTGQANASAESYADWAAVPDGEARAVRRMLQAFATRLGRGPEVELLYGLGIMRGAGNVPDVRDQPQRREAVRRLRQARLLSPEDPRRPDELDAHPLVRAYFAEQMRTTSEETWRRAHSGAFDRLVASAVDLPTTLEEMAPLYTAIAYGCRAGRVAEAFEEVYWRRIERGEQFYSSHTLGADGANLAALANFVVPATQLPRPELSPTAAGWVMNELGIALQSLGRLDEAVEPLTRGLSIREANRDWRLAAWSAQNLYELQLMRGHTHEAHSFAQRGVQHATVSKDSARIVLNVAALGDALHHVGRLEEAQNEFFEAMRLQPVLEGIAGYWHCDLLLALEQHEQVRDRLDAMRRADTLLDEGLVELLRGRLRMAEDEIDEARRHLADAAALLRREGRVDWLLRVLLARAELERRAQRFDMAESDLTDVLGETSRSGMRLYELEAWLTYARLNADRSDASAAAAALAQARAQANTLGIELVQPWLAALDEQVAARLDQTEQAMHDRWQGDPLALLFRLVLDRKAPPDILRHLDPSRLPTTLGGAERLRELDLELARRHAGVEPNQLWTAWVRATRAGDVSRLEEFFADGNIRADAR